MIGKLIGVGLILLVIGSVAYTGNWYSSKTTFADKVKEKWIKDVGGDQIYLFSTANHGVLQNTDEWLFGKYNSADFYANIEPNQCYQFTTIGWRIPILSWYQNILQYAPVAC